jgi:hypothetical protein
VGWDRPARAARNKMFVLWPWFYISETLFSLASHFTG